MALPLSRLLIPLLALLPWGVAVCEIAPTLSEGTMLAGGQLQVVSAEQEGQVSAEVRALLAAPFDQTAAVLSSPENWCQFLPLHFNIKACTFEQSGEGAVLTLYNGRKGYQSPQESSVIRYRFTSLPQETARVVVLLQAQEGPAGTRDYRIRLELEPAAEGSRLQIHSSYRPSFTSTLLTNGYLATLGRDKVGFSQVSDGNGSHLVQGVRGVIERNVVRYYLAIDTFLANVQIDTAEQHAVSLDAWFARNERYALQLHEMERAEYLSIKQREWQNQQRLQQVVNERQRLAVR